MARDEGARSVLDHAARKLSPLAYLHEQHVWFELPLAVEPSGPGLPAGSWLERADEDTLELAAATGKDPRTARRLLAAGHELWMVRDAAGVSFSCWVFHRRTPAVAARSGWLELPDRTVCLEYATTSADQRGMGIATAALVGIGSAMHREGARAVVGKVKVANVASRRACGKAGFREIGRMELTRVGPWHQVRFSDPGGRSGAAIARALTRRSWPQRWLPALQRT